MAAPPEVIVVEPERMNLLGLMLQSVLTRRLSGKRALAHAAALSGDVLIEASGMQVTLRFTREGIRVTREASAHPRASVRGKLTALLDAALGRHRVRSVLKRELSVSGSPRALWHVFGLLGA
jgi:hypothetical protein